MRNKRMKYLFITGLFVSMFSFGAIDASAAGFSNISESAGLIVRTEDATESGSGDGGSGDGSSSNAAQNHQDLPTYTDKTGSSKEGSPDQEVGGTPASTPASTPETTPEPTSEPSTNIVTPAAKPAAKPAKTEKKVEVKAENRIDSITIKNTDAGKSVARIYFHLDDDYSNVSFFMKASGKNEELAATSDFAETGYKIQDGEEQDGINYYFVIDTKSSLSDYYSSISQQIKDLQRKEQGIPAETGLKQKRHEFVDSWRFFLSGTSRLWLKVVKYVQTVTVINYLRGESNETKASSFNDP